MHDKQTYLAEATVKPARPERFIPMEGVSSTHETMSHERGRFIARCGVTSERPDLVGNRLALPTTCWGCRDAK